MPRIKPKVVKYLAAALNEPLEYIFPPASLSEAEREAYFFDQLKRLRELQLAKLELLMEHHKIPKDEPPGVRHFALNLCLAQDYVAGLRIVPDTRWDFLRIDGDRKTRKWPPRSKVNFFDYVTRAQSAHPEISVADACEHLLKCANADLAKPTRARELAAQTKSLENVFAKIARMKRAN